jgi:hypothetical protein
MTYPWAQCGVQWGREDNDTLTAHGLVAKMFFAMMGYDLSGL